MSPSKFQFQFQFPVTLGLLLFCTILITAHPLNDEKTKEESLERRGEESTNNNFDNKMTAIPPVSSFNDDDKDDEEARSLDIFDKGSSSSCGLPILFDAVSLGTELYTKFTQEETCIAKSYCELHRFIAQYWDHSRSKVDRDDDGNIRDSVAPVSRISLGVINLVETLPLHPIFADQLSKVKLATMEGIDREDCDVLYKNCKFSFQKTFFSFEKRTRKCSRKMEHIFG